MIYPVVQQMTETPEPGRSPVRVSVAARVLRFSKQAYYHWRKSPVSTREIEDARLIEAIYQIHADDPTYGYRLICDELHDLGFTLSERRCWRLCSAHQVFSTTLKRYRMGKPAVSPAEDDRVRRVFTAPEPNQVWLTDITEHPTRQGKLYLCAVKDVWANRIVGWSIADRMETSLAVDALTDAWSRRGRPTGVVIHSDRGSQFGSRRFIEACRQMGFCQSMGQARTCADNAAMESFFSLLQKNILNQRRTWATTAELRQAIVHWIEATYNRRRRQRRLGNLTPVQYETIHAATYQLAA